MGEVRLSFSGLGEAKASFEELQSLLDRLPEQAKKELGKGFERISSVPPEKLEAAFQEIGSHITQTPDPAALGRMLGMSVPDARAVAMAIAIFAVTARHVGPSGFFSALTPLGITSPEKARTLTALVGPIYEKQKPQIEKQIVEQEIAYEVLPNLIHHSWAVDLRPYYRDGKLRGFVPVGMLTLGTDMKDIFMSVQLSPSDFSNFFRALEAMKSRMEDLQSYATAFEAKK
jgi:hypothetical protein